MKEDEKIRECAVVRLIVYVLAVVLAVVFVVVYGSKRNHTPTNENSLHLV